MHPTNKYERRKHRKLRREKMDLRILKGKKSTQYEIKDTLPERDICDLCGSELHLINVDEMYTCTNPDCVLHLEEVLGGGS